MASALEGLRVVDFSWAIAGPQLTRCLADFGATVIKVESHTHLDLVRTNPPFKDSIPGINRSGYWAGNNVNKYGISLNLNHPKAFDIVKMLIPLADVVIENFSPGTVEKWGLGYNDLVKIKPDIIMVSLSICGQTGPYASQGGFGMQADALSGFCDLTGWEDSMPSMFQGLFGDTLVAALALCATMAAIDCRRTTGKGQHLDLSQIEAAAFFLGPLFLDFSINGRLASRVGNRHPWAAPHGVYPCHGQDRWCALSVSTDEEWHGLCSAMGNHKWALESRFATVLGRKENEEELDRLINSWTIDYEPQELMILLQKEGVAAGAVLDNEGLESDCQLRHRKAVDFTMHPEIGCHGYDTLPFKLSRAPVKATSHAPLLGEHNEYIYKQILGISDEEFVQFINEGVFD